MLDEKVPSVRAALHVLELRRKYLLSTVTIGLLAGVDHGIIDHIIYPLDTPQVSRPIITRRQERAILSVSFNLEDLSHDPDLLRLQISPVGTQRRIKALGRIGWSLGDLGKLLGGVTTQAVGSYLKAERIHVTVRTAVQVKEVYDRLSLQLGPTPLAAKHAARRGWPPPWSWDEETIDDPDAEPDLDCIVRPAHKGLDDSLEDIDWILHHQPTATRGQVAHRLGMTADGISTIMRKAKEAAYVAVLEETLGEGACGPLEWADQVIVDNQLKHLASLQDQMDRNTELAGGPTQRRRAS